MTIALNSRLNRFISNLQVQWPNSIAKHNYDNNAYQEGYLWYLRKYHRSKRTSLFNGRNIISTTTSSYVENRK